MKMYNRIWRCRAPISNDIPGIRVLCKVYIGNPINRSEIIILPEKPADRVSVRGSR